MIDRNLLLTDFEKTSLRLQRKGVEIATLIEARDLLLQRNQMQNTVDNKRSQMNKASKEIGELVRNADPETLDRKKAETNILKTEISELEISLKDIGEKLEYILMRIPNIPDDKSPNGTTEADNVVLETVGYSPSDYEDKKFRPHWEIGEELQIYDGERGAKITGSMFALLKGDGVRLLRALVNLALDLHRDKYEEILPPHLVNSQTFTATGHLPKFEFDSYKLQNEDLWLIPTGEVPLTALHRDEILQEEELPKRYMAYTSCFRREAGSSGKDTRGMQRLHEFHKVELVRLCTPETAEQEFEELLADARKPLDLLGLPYRVLDLCAGDLTFSSARIFDLEVYSPGVNRWLEVSSVGLFTDFQTRRGGVRYKPSGAKNTRFVYALNGSAIATPRMWAAIIEHGHQADGSVKLPSALVPYMGKEFIGRK